MKNLKKSVLENAHLFIMVITLGIICGVWGAKLQHKTVDSSYASFASFGYVPTTTESEQYALAPRDVEQRQPNLGPEFNYVKNSIQFAVDTEQQVMSPNEVQQKQLNAGRGEAEQLTPAS